MAHQLQNISDVARKWFVAKVAHLVEGVLQKSSGTNGFKVHNHLDFLRVIINLGKIYILYDTFNSLN